MGWTSLDCGNPGVMGGTTLDCVVRVLPEVMDQHVGGESVLLHLGVGRYFGLNSTGTRIWLQLREGRPLAEIHRDLVRTYGEAAGALKVDLLELVEALRDAGIVTVSGPGS